MSLYVIFRTSSVWWFSLLEQLSVSLLSHLDAKVHNYINQSLKYIVVFMFHPDRVQHHHNTRFSLVVKLLKKNREWTVCPWFTNFTLHCWVSQIFKVKCSAIWFIGLSLHYIWRQEITNCTGLSDFLAGFKLLRAKQAKIDKMCQLLWLSLYIRSWNAFFTL